MLLHVYRKPMYKNWFIKEYYPNSIALLPIIYLTVKNHPIKSKSGLLASYLAVFLGSPYPKAYQQKKQAINLLIKTPSSPTAILKETTPCTHCLHSLAFSHREGLVIGGRFCPPVKCP